MALKFKTKKKSTVNKLRVSKYENPVIALELIAQICSVKGNDDIKNRNLSKIDSWLNEISDVYDNHDFFIKIEQKAKKIVDVAIQFNDNIDYMPVVVAGGFSAGKSSMINKITNIGNLLPTGTEPVSVVETHIYCTDKENDLSIKGENLTGHLVDLETDVLESIQHSSETKVYIASVLKKIQIETTAPNTKGIVFIDTPGYNNSDKANVESGKTDRDTALKALERGEVLFWLIDIEGGTILKKDLKIINDFNGDKVIIFNKADKKPKSEIPEIIDLASKIINIKQRKDIIDIIAFSSFDNDCYHSYNNISFDKLITKIKNKTKTNNSYSHDNIIKQIENLFDEEIKELYETIKYYEENLNKYFDKRKNYYLDRSEKVKTLMDIFGNYDSILQKASTVSTDAINELVRILNYDSTYIYKKEKVNDNCGEYIKTFNEIKWDYNPIEDVKYYAKKVDALEKNELDYLNSKIKKYKEIISDIEDVIKILKLKKQILKDLIEEILENIKKEKEKPTTANKNKIQNNIFNAIQQENMIWFYECLAKGVDISVCNDLGFNPVTLAVKYGNNEIVKFFIDKKVDLTLKDKRGYNAIETAVQYQFKDIFDLLIAADESLFKNNNYLIELSKQNENRFTNYLETKNI